MQDEDKRTVRHPCAILRATGGQARSSCLACERLGGGGGWRRKSRRGRRRGQEEEKKKKKKGEEEKKKQQKQKQRPEDKGKTENGQKQKERQRERGTTQGPNRPHEHKDLRFWFQGLVSGGHFKSWYTAYYVPATVHFYYMPYTMYMFVAYTRCHRPYTLY